MGKIVGIWTVVAMLCLCAGAAAVPQNTMMGPYNVSFDLGTDDPLIITPLDDEYSESLEGGTTINRDIIIESDGGVVALSIKELQEDGDFWAEVCAKDIELEFVGAGNGIGYCTPRMIDGQPGWIGAGWIRETDRHKAYDTVYVAKYNTHNATAWVSIVSFCLWDEGTLSILKTIHIERQDT